MPEPTTTASQESRSRRHTTLRVREIEYPASGAATSRFARLISRILLDRAITDACNLHGTTLHRQIGKHVLI